METREIVAIISFVFLSILLFGFDWFLYYRFKNFLNKPFRSISINKKDLYPDYLITDTLYKSYKELPKGKFKIVKMSLRSWSNINNPLQQIIDIFTKLVFTLLLSIAGVSITVSVALLSFYNSNTEVKKDYYSWIKGLTNLLEGFRDGMDTYLIIIIIGIILFILVSNHLFISTFKSKLIKRHLVIIEEIEKENS